MNMNKRIGLQHAARLLTDAGYSYRVNSSSVALVIDVSANEQDALRDIRAIVGEGFSVVYTGDGNTDNDGHTTNDAFITLVASENQ